VADSHVTRPLRLCDAFRNVIRCVCGRQTDIFYILIYLACVVFLITRIMHNNDDISTLAFLYVCLKINACSNMYILTLSRFKV